MAAESRPQSRVLVVDDDPAIRALLCVVLERAGFAVDVANDGASALDYIRSNRYVVALLDLMMPRVNGYDLIAALRDIPSRPCIIVVTAMADAFIEGLDPTVVHSIIRKPFDIAMVTAVVTQISSALETIRLTGNVVPFDAPR